MLKNFLYNNWPYLFLICIGLLLLTNETSLSLNLQSRILNNGGSNGSGVDTSTQRVVGVLAITFSIYKIFQNRRHR